MIRSRSYLRKNKLSPRRRIYRRFRLVDYVVDGDQIDAILFDGDRYEMVEGKTLKARGIQPGMEVAYE